MSTGRPHRYGHLLQVWKEYLQPLTLYTSFHDLINVYSRRSGQTTPLDKILMSTETSCHLGHLLQVSKTSLSSLILYIFFMILYMYIAPGPGLSTPWGQNFDVNRNILSLRSFVASFKKSLWSLILYNFFHDFIHVHSPGAGADSPQETKFWCQQKCLVTSFNCCKFQKNVFEVWFLYNFFRDLIHVYSPGAGADSSKGTKFWCQQKSLITLPICCKFQRNLFEVWFLYNFFHDLIHVYIPGGGGIQLPGDKVLKSTETSCHFGHLLLVSNHRRQQFLKNPLFYLFPIQTYKWPNLTLS